MENLVLYNFYIKHLLRKRHPFETSCCADTISTSCTIMYAANAICSSSHLQPERGRTCELKQMSHRRGEGLFFSDNHLVCRPKPRLCETVSYIAMQLKFAELFQRKQRRATARAERILLPGRDCLLFLFTPRHGPRYAAYVHRTESIRARTAHAHTPALTYTTYDLVMK